MNSRTLQVLGLTLGLALFVATGLLVSTGAKHEAAAPAAAPPPVGERAVASIRALSDTFAEVAERVRPAVVTVYSAKVVKFRQPDWWSPFGEDFPFRWFFDQGQPGPRAPRGREYEFRQGGLGSGIIIDREGYILTNHHVVQDVDEIKITLADKRSFKARVVGTDELTDLAVIQITDEIPRDLPVAELGDSEIVRVGDWVLAVGAPFGYEQTVTAGIISAKGRAGVEPSTGSIRKFEDFIQTDAAINPGNSGGPLVNLAGQVVGINTAIATRGAQQFAGVGFAIPVNMAKDLVPRLAKGQSIRRGLLGIVIQDIDEDLAQQFGLTQHQGALVAQVNPDSPAAKAGIQVGDVINRYAGKQVVDTRQLRNLVAATEPGSKIEIGLLRNGKPRSVTAQLGELTPAAVAAAGSEPPASAADLGLAVEALTPDKARQLGYEDEEGVLISQVEDGSPAAAAGLQAGDLITEVNRQKVTNVREFNDARNSAKGKDAVLMLVKSRGVSRFVIVRVK